MNHIQQGLFDTSKIMDVKGVVALEQKLASEDTPLLELMKRAGAAMAKAAMDAMPAGATGNVVVFAGTGNNGGDGWVAAELLAESFAKAGSDACVSLVTPIEHGDIFAEPARTAVGEIYTSSNGKPPFDVLVAPELDKVDQLLKASGIVIDAMLGSGFAHSEVREPMKGWIDAINSARETTGCKVIAADCPSGLNAQTGRPSSTMVKADTTVTMLAVKTGLVQSTAKPYVGELILAPLV